MYAWPRVWDGGFAGKCGAIIDLDVQGDVSGEFEMGRHLAVVPELDAFEDAIEGDSVHVEGPERHAASAKSGVDPITGRG